CILSAPFYFPYPQAVVLSGLMAVARQSSLPIVLYNIPKYAGEITLDSFRALMQERNIIGVKDSSGTMVNLLNLVSIRDEIRPDFSVLVGWEEMLYSALLAGGQGCMTASSGIFPEIMRDIFRAVQEKSYDYALRCQKLIAGATAVFGNLFFPLGYQWAMEARGIPMGAYPVSCDEAAFAPQRQAIENAVAETLAGYTALRAEATCGNEAL
ncbi:MAG: dihydrodipicolinate synthase family protein, partial [Clostridiales bacterium]